MRKACTETMHLADTATPRLGPALSTISPRHLRIAHRRAVIKIENAHSSDP
jgi:hypothetical protein